MVLTSNDRHFAKKLAGAPILSLPIVAVEIQQRMGVLCPVVGLSSPILGQVLYSKPLDCSTVANLSNADLGSQSFDA
jgi:hypothetical protein